MSYHLSLVTEDYHRVRPKQYLTSMFGARYAPSTNGPKQDSNPRHLGVPSGASKTIYEPWYVSHKKGVPILRQD
jgi:hypothetical protein